MGDSQTRAELKDLYVSWLDSEIESAKTYHDQKEQMAWTATAFYVGGVVTLATALGRETPLTLAVVLSILISILGLAALLFIGMQFEFRWKAADQLVALRRVRGKIASGQIRLEGDDVLISDERRSDGRLSSWPRFIEREIRCCERKRTAREMWGALWLALTFRFGRLKTVSGRVRSEVASYTVVALGTLLSLLAVNFG